MSYRFQPLAEHFANGLSRTLPSALRRGGYCLGFHVRHVLAASDRVPIGICAPPSVQAAAMRTRDTNDSKSLHTLNHVLDSLYYHDRIGRVDAADDADDADEVGIRITYDLALDADKACHLLEDRADLPKRKAYSSDPALIVSCMVAYPIGSLQLGLSPASPLDPSSTVLDAKVRKPSRNDRTLFAEYVCGCQKLCEQLRLHPSILAYRSLAAAVYSLGTYATICGPHTLTYMRRSRHPYGFAIGFTLITPHPLVGAALQKTIATAKNVFDTLRNPEQAKPLLAKYVGWENGPTPRTGSFPTPPPPVGVSQELANWLWAGERSSTAASAVLTALQIGDSVANFLQVSSLFCDEQIEGQDLQFGLLMGNTALLNFWPGQAPIAIGPDDAASEASKLPSYIHLLAGPSRRCLVLSYPTKSWHADAHLSWTILELHDYGEEIADWRDGHLWPDDLVPYAYFTRRYPWALGVVVGPHSEIRVFARGRLVAFRSGKGWRLLRDPSGEDPKQSISPRNDADAKRRNDAIAALKEWRKSLTRCNRDTVEAALRVALQMSPLVRHGSHGGFIVFAPVDYAAEDGFWKPAAAHFLPLRGYEPKRSGGRKWLTGLSLLHKGSMDPAVARLLLRAASLDGAIVLCNPHATVKFFARQLVYTPKSKRVVPHSDEVPSGTKRANAMQFVSAMAKKHSGSFAIAISADGPVRLYFHQSGKAHEFNVFDEVYQE